MQDVNELSQRICQAFTATYNQHNRLLTIESALGNDALIVHTPSVILTRKNDDLINCAICG